MPVPYSRSISFSTTSSTVCVRIPAPFRGKLTRLTLTQVSGTPVGGEFRIYDRKGACAAATDLNVRLSGVVSAITTNVSGCQVVFTDTHGLYVGDQFVIKGCSVSTYNTTHTVLSVVNGTTVVSNVAFSSNGAGGLWQTPPFMPTRTPATHLILQEEVFPNAPLYRLDLDRMYENRDNQNSTTRLASDSLWLEFVPSAGAGAATWELGYSVYPSSFVA